MPYIIFILLLLQSSFLFGQCRDVFDNNVSCPTMDDSLVVYNNAVKVYEYYEHNKSYLKTRSQQLESISDKKQVYESLEEAKRMFFIIRREVKKLSESEKKFTAGRPSIKYKDITYKDYYEEIDEYRFFQREMENQIVNINAPSPIYDSRITPILINEYKNIDSSDIYFGDLVNIPLYIPVIVKPFSLLTSSELALRNEILKIVPIVTLDKTYFPKKVVVVRHSIDRDTIKIEKNNPFDGIPIYAYNELGSGALVGFLVNKKFVKIQTSDYEKYAVPNFVRELLKNDNELNKMLKIKFGGYYLGLY